ncbi:MAG: hypothetical protein ACXVB0_17225 [Mucilaginibacter sp.]
MTFFDKLFKKKLQPEDNYLVTITDEWIRVEHPKWGTESIFWKEVHAILLINTDEGPFIPDIWLTLIGDNGKCMIPHGCKGFEDVYQIVSKYKGFNFDNVSKSMAITHNAEFLLWTNKQ